ncbi:LOW QUALITY PROTEIN: uncharacterized protein LOC129590815 [Paramacrobiotus metropolitanus]|uniref:LOW QUALITY PROTEIN: uncharacterized protein LOC129590815 n=1 Tax=Paramacrobiotus metropolitanus TaxID=2943436 RepID=UPI00244643E8|nr:LOW QUALITY PROTEIN: uncharacterized protein LOC129590815 [Paramacrobiotus metropolitanus]
MWDFEGYSQDDWQRGDSPAGIPFYINHKEQTTHWDHPLLTKIFAEDIASYNDVRYAAYRTALKFRTLSNRLQLHQIKLSTIRSVLKQHGYEAVYQNHTLIPCVELETLVADIYLSARRELPSIDQPEVNAELLLCLLLKLYDTNRCGTIKLISAKIGLALLASGSYLEKWKYILGELFDYNRCLSRKNAFNLLVDVARIPEILGEKRLFGTHLVPAAVESLWIRGRPTSVGLTEDGFRHWLRDEPQTLVWLSTSYRIRQAERIRHHIKCSVCRTQPFNGLRYRCLRCYNYNMCQNCFFTGKFNKSHRLRHPIREYSSYVTAGQETKDLIKIMRNRVFRGEDYEPKPRYMPILPDSASAMEFAAGADSDREPDTADNRSRSTAPSHGNSTGTPSGSVSAVNKKDFEVDVEVISELDSAHGGISDLQSERNYMPRSISEPIDAHFRLALQQPPTVPEDALAEEADGAGRPAVDVTIKSLDNQTQITTPAQPSVVPKDNPPAVTVPPLPVLWEPQIPAPVIMKERSVRQEPPAHPSPATTKRQISAVTAQILNYTEVDVLLPKVQPSVPSIPVKGKTKYTEVVINKPPTKSAISVQNDQQRVGQSSSSEFSTLDYIDASPRGEPPIQYERIQPRSLYPKVISKSSVEVQTDVAERAVNLDEIRRQVHVMQRENRELHDQFDAMHRLVDSSSPSPELIVDRSKLEHAISRNANFEAQLEHLEKMLVDNMGPRTAPNGYDKRSLGRPPVEKWPGIGSRPLPGAYNYVGRSGSFNDSLYHPNDTRLPPFPVDNQVPKAISDPNTPLKRSAAPPPPQRHLPVAETNGVHYHPILDELEEKLRLLNAPLTPRDLKHPFWHHLKEKFESVMGQPNRSPAVGSVSYQSYGKIDKDYAHTPANYGRNIAYNSTLDVSDHLIPGIAHPSPNESQSSGFSSGRETDLKWEEERSVSANYRMPRSKSLGLASHRQVSDDIAQLDKLLEWLDEFKKST